LIFFSKKLKERLEYKKLKGSVIVNRLKVTKRVLVLSMEEKKNSNLYNFIDLETNSVFTALGVTKEIKLHTPIEAILNISIDNELLELKDGTRKFVNTSKIFVEELRDLA